MKDLSVEINAHIAGLKSLQIASLNTSGRARISYTPFVFVHQHFYILISELANHYQNLSQQAQCEIMLIEDENTATNIFARTRLICQCHASSQGIDASEQTEVQQEMRRQLGDTVELLLTLKDFHLFRLKIESGRFVTGFAKAYDFNGSNFSLCTHQKGT